MSKWYENAECDTDVVIGGQLCLVRNVDGYPFEAKMSRQEQTELLDRVCQAVREEESRLGIYFELRGLSDIDNCYRSSLIGRLAIPPLMLGTSGSPGLLVTPDESVSILVNGTEHICIQVSSAGRHMKEIMELASRVDEAINMHLPYAFSRKYGYLTASPLYTGTGMSASYLLHLPNLERDQLAGKYARELAQFGFTLRGHFHGNGQAPADVYRLKNRKTLGLSEEETLSALEHLTGQLSQQEKRVWSDRSDDEKKTATDQMYRAYGLLKYARDLDFEETLEYLSYVRSGYQYHVWDSGCEPDIFAMMIAVQDAVMISGQADDDNDIQSGIRRASYIRSTLPGIEEV